MHRYPASAPYEILIGVQPFYLTIPFSSVVYVCGWFSATQEEGYVSFVPRLLFQKSDLQLLSTEIG